MKRIGDNYHRWGAVDNKMAFARAIVVFAVLSLTFCSHLDIAESSSAHDTTATISFLEGGVVAEIEVCSGSYCGDFNGKKRVVETRIEDNVSDFPARVFLRRIQDYWILGFFSTRTDSRQILLPERSHSGLEVEQSNYTETECDDSIPQINKCGSISPYTRQNADLGTAMEEGYERRISHQTRNAYPSDSYEGERK